MIIYPTLGTNDLHRAGNFYDALLAKMGAQRVMQLERRIGWSNAPGSPMFAVIKPFDGQLARVGNGARVAVHVADTARIDALHNKALALGGKDEGPPGLRGGTFYAANFRDLDGNKIALVRMYRMGKTLQMRKERMEFLVDGDTVVGDLYLPVGDAPHAAVILGGPMTSVKEQVTGVYAQALAARGFAALAIDHRHYGESSGTPRQYEHYGHKIADLRAGLDALTKHRAIDATRIGAVGVCLGAGYALWAAVDSPHVKAVGAVAGYYRDVADLRARDPGGFQAKVDAGIAARQHYETTGEVLTVPAVALTGDAAMTLPETFDYYGTARAAVPNYQNAFAIMSREHFLPFDVQPVAARLRVPVVMVHSERALSPHWARKFYESITAQKQILWISSLGQVDFYDDPKLVSQACDYLADHLHSHLQ